VQSHDELKKLVECLVYELRQDREQREIEAAWLRSHVGLATKHDIHNLQKQIEKLMATQADMVTQLNAVLAQEKKTAEEIKAVQAASDVLKQRITDLEAIVAAGGDATPELEKAVADVKAQAQIVDDEIPDITAPKA